MCKSKISFMRGRLIKWKLATVQEIIGWYCNSTIRYQLLPLYVAGYISLQRMKNYSATVIKEACGFSKGLPVEVVRSVSDLFTPSWINESLHLMDLQDQIQHLED